MSAEYEVVDIWVGSFPSEEVLTDYLAERYDEDDEDAPISQFAEEQNETFFDFMFMEFAFNENATHFGELCGERTFSESYLAAATKAHEALALGDSNSIVIVFGKEITEPQSVKGEDFDLTYIGRFKSRPPQT